MAKYVSGSVFKISGDTTEYVAAMKRAATTRENLARMHITAAEKEKEAELNLAHVRSDVAQAEEARRAAVKKVNDLKDEGKRKTKEYAAAVKEAQAAVLKHTAALDRLDRAEEKAALTKKLLNGRIAATEQKLAAQTKAAARMNTAWAKSRELAGSFAGKLAASFSLGLIFSQAKRLTDELDKMAKTARDVGLNASGLMALNHYTKLSGVSVDRANKAWKTFHINLGLAGEGVKERTKAFESLGIEIRDANGNLRATPEVLNEVRIKFAGIESAAERAVIASRLFEKESAADVLRILESIGNEMPKAFNDTRIDEAAAAAERLKDTFENISYNTLPYIYKALGKDIELIDKFLSGKSENDYIAQRAGFGSYGAHSVSGMVATDKTKAELAAAINKREKLRAAGISQAGMSSAMGAAAAGLMIQREKKAYSEKMAAIDAEIKRLLDKARLEFDEAHKREQERKKAIKAAEDARKLAPNVAAIAKAREKLADAQRGELTLAEQIAAVKKTIAAETEKVAAAEKNSKEHAEAVTNQVAAKIELIRLERAEREKTDREAKTRADRLKQEAKAEAEKQKKLNDARAEARNAYKTASATVRGDKDELKRLEFERRKTEYMEKHGVSEKEASLAVDLLQKSEAAKEGKTEYSDEAKKRAQSVLDRQDKGKRVGKKELADAEAILAGNAVELKSGRFKKYDARASLENDLNFSASRYAATVDEERRKNGEISEPSGKGLDKANRKKTPISPELRLIGEKIDSLKNELSGMTAAVRDAVYSTASNALY